MSAAVATSANTGIIMPMDDPLLLFDRAIGNALERVVRSHHGRRLCRIGWGRAIDPPDGELWAAGEPPPRADNAVEVLIDGEEMLPRLAAELRRARSHVHIAGWYVSPYFRLEDGGSRTELKPLLAELAERIDVRVLLWAGSPLPLFRPDRKDVDGVRHALEFGTRIRVARDSKERPMHCHHEKVVVIDDRVAFVGGIDLTSYAGDRFDAQAHPARGRRGWHDAAVVLRGPIVADVAEHFRLRWREIAGEELPAAKRPRRAGPTEAQFVRTVPEQVYEALPGGDFRILESYTRALCSAERLVYLENQFYWSSEIAAILEGKLRDPPSDEFRVVLVLPRDPNSGGDDTRGQLAHLLECDGGRGRVLACGLQALGELGPHDVYVHAKIGIVDDHWLTIGSANLNEHSLFNDTEANVVTRNAELARATRLRLWGEHVGRPVAELDGDPTRVIDDVWKPIAAEQLARREAGLEPTHRLIQLPHLSRRSRRLLGPVTGLLVDG
jgi:phosphatidylserine/phosphatidylglycerophosphate/cardiolipin synthase-like enzyme